MKKIFLVLILFFCNAIALSDQRENDLKIKLEQLKAQRDNRNFFTSIDKDFAGLVIFLGLFTLSFNPNINFINVSMSGMGSILIHSMWIQQQQDQKIKKLKEKISGAHS